MSSSNAARIATYAPWVVLGASMLLFWAGTLQAFGFAPARQFGDAWNYLGAGERLNAGHPLYALSAGDRPIDILAPYWPVPLMSPPPIAVAWRVPALLGDPSMVLWGTLCLVGTLAGLAVILLGADLRVAIVATILAAPVAIQAVSGNVNGLLFPALLVAWYLRERPVVVGTIIASAIAIKLAPALLIFWLIAAGRRRALVATVAALVVIGIVSVAGSSIEDYAAWIASVPRAAPAPGAVATMLGVPSTVVLVGATLIVLAVALRRDERWTFTAAIVAATLASPALYLGHVGLAAAALAPWLRPIGARLRSFRDLRRSAATSPTPSPSSG